tara:strand:+ start:2096 stop:2692 length:597 start_codon:yes stop_codon:yes gene_type:complete
MKKLLYTLLAVSIIFSACEEDTPLPAPNNNNNNSALAIGDTHQGGIIFYLDGNGGGLIAAPEDLEGTYEWGCLLTQVEDGGNLTQIGTGYQNTLDIVDQECSTEFGGIPAAQAAKDAQINGFNDWYLPSRDELYQMYLKIGQGGLDSNNNIGDFGSSEYWSSSESNFSNSWIVSFSVGLTESISKNSFSTKVRVIRSF